MSDIAFTHYSGDLPVPRRYWVLLKVKLDYPKPSVVVGCPQCGIGILLDHSVEANGDVQGLIVCSNVACKHSCTATLKGWVRYGARAAPVTG